MILFALIHLLLAELWVFFTNDTSAINWLTGAGLAYVAIFAFCHLSKKSTYHFRLYYAVYLFFYFIIELFTSSLRVLWDVITPGHFNKPAFIAMPLTAKTDLGIFFTANLISLTPGTLTMDIAPDRNTLYVHAMFAGNKERTIKSLKHFESKVLRVFE